MNIDFTTNEIALMLGCIIVAEPTMPNDAIKVAISIVDKLGDALKSVGV